MAPSRKGHKDDSSDPYATLGITLDATDAEISKAYKKLALKLHPDKQQNKNLSPAQQEAVAKQFHDIKEARSFLLDAEHREERDKYKTKRHSERVRKDADERRERTMSERRKFMRDELERREQMAAQTQKGTEKSSSNKKRERDLEKLRREGKEMRESHMERAAMKELKKQEKEQRKAKNELEDRQIRLKWDTKREHGLGENGESPSEHSIASFLSSRFGQVERVELLGAKGNVALVTFADPSSCKPCVDTYENSKEMRAKFVGRRKEREEAKEFEDVRVPFDVRRQTEETHNDQRIRQAAEREKILKQMEEEDMNDELGISRESPREQTQTDNMPKRPSQFPLPIPTSGQYKGLSPFQVLEMFEESVLVSKRHLM